VTPPLGGAPVIPGYQLLGEIGRGGMGVVYRARQESLGRIVALKVLRVRPGDDTGALKRMRREAETLARLSHPHIVTVYDAGAAGEWFYFAMEYVAGVDLHRLVERTGPLSPERARDYLRQAALGLQHAFEHGLVHRDVKPSNLIVTEQPGRSLLKILDLGLARAPADTPDAVVTMVGTFLGTPDFIAPEQADDAHAADIRSDLYSLGCTFYYTLTGRAPYANAVTPLAKLMQHQLAEPPVLNPTLTGGLSAIIRKLMARNRADRYQTPNDLVRALDSDDKVTRWQGDKVTEAEAAPPSSVTLSPCHLVTLSSARKLSGPGDWVKCVAFSPDGTVLAAGSLDRTVRLWESSGAQELGRIHGHTAGVLCLAFSSAGTELATGCQDRVLSLWDLRDGPARARLRWRSLGHGGNVNAVAFLPGGDRLLSGSHDGTLRLWESATGRELRSMRAHGGAVWSVAVSPDGRLALSGGNDRLIRLWDLERGEARANWPEQDGPVSCVAFSPDGRFLLSGGGKACLWDVAGGREVRALDGHQGRVLAGAFSPDGRWVLTGSRDQAVRLFDVASGRCLATATEHTWWVTGVAWAPAGNVAASGSGDRTVCLWRIEQ
jgi:WD40 repeat protein